MAKIILLLSFFLLPQFFCEVEKSKIISKVDFKKNEPKNNQNSEIIDISTYGTLWLNKDRNCPILIVFGGIPVGGRQSGEYMWDFLEPLKHRYHIFVSKNHKIVGDICYQLVLKELQRFGILNNSKILYLFSGGWSPGKSVLDKYSGDFEKVLLVDIWMGNSVSSNFYKIYTSKNFQKVEYYYTHYGSQNKSATLDIIKNASKSKICEGKNSHMLCNVLACESLNFNR